MAAGTSPFRLPVPVDVGSGAPIVLLHGFGMRPSTYRATAELLATRARVVVPDLFAIRGRWDYNRVLDAFVATLDHLGLEKVTVIGHSFGGAIELDFACRHPGKVTELVFSDTLAVSEEWGLADEALRRPWELVRLASVPAVTAFFSQWVTRPRQLAGAAWWAFRFRRQGLIECVGEAGISSHVLWASRDSILPQADGRAFAKQLDATFTVASAPDGRPVDHDWMFENPHLFAAHLADLDLHALRS